MLTPSLVNGVLYLQQTLGKQYRNSMRTINCGSRIRSGQECPRLGIMKWTYCIYTVQLRLFKISRLNSIKHHSQG